jgi:hypothetical protein
MKDNNTIALLDKFNNRTTTTRPDDRGYTDYAWRGNGSDLTGDVTAIAKVIRAAVKAKYPGVKLSVRTNKYSGGSNININLMSAPFDVFATPDATKLRGADLRWGLDDAMKQWDSIIDSGHFGVNHYYIDDSIYLTDAAKDFFNFINTLCLFFNRNDSDAMIDYFDTNFYYSLGVGKWDAPFIKTN